MLIEDFRTEFARYRILGERAIAQVPDSALNTIPAPDGNSIAMIVRHVSGNLISRFTDFLTTDGEKPTRDRDREFADQSYSRRDVDQLWKAGWDVLEQQLGALQDSDSEKQVTIRQQSLTVHAALSRSLAHISYHVGQLVLLGRMYAKGDWEWLSIPKAKSVASLALAALAVISCAAPESRPRDSSAVDSSAIFVVDPAGIGRVRTGVTLGQLSTVVGEELHARNDISDACGFVSPRILPPGVSLMVISDTVARVDIVKSGVQTSVGAQVGDSEPRVLELYKGLVQVQPHKYTGPEGHYLVVTPPSDSVNRIIFETDGKVVTRYRAGRRPAVEYVEGCA